MHITYFTDVHKSDQVKGLSRTITENIFCREFVYNFFLQRSERRLRIINVISCFKKASLLLKKNYLEEIVPSVLVNSYLFISNRLPYFSKFVRTGSYQLLSKGEIKIKYQPINVSWLSELIIH